ncbi:MAG: Toluene tolerance [Nevskia sp.]|nr:Toluene tolerance [Nevskia sp.]
MSRLRWCCLLSLMFAAAVHADDKSVDSKAADVVTALHATLLDNMKRGAALGCSGRVQHMATAIDADFDLPFIGQRVLRRHWDEISADQRKQFMDAFRKLVLSTYASQFKRFGGESFTTLDAQAVASGESIVHARLTTGSGGTVSFDYVLHPVTGSDGSSWRVINVIADGVSDLALRSSQYDQIYKERGFDGLLAWIREQDKKTLADCS